MSPKLRRMDSRQIIAALKELRVPHDRIAAVIGRDRSAATKMLNGKRSVKVNEVAPLTDLIEEFRAKGGDEGLSIPAAAPAVDPRVIPTLLQVRYRVRAGLWQEVEFEEPPEDIAYPVLPNPKFAEWPQWLELVEGDSANLKIPDGHYIHVVDAREMGYAPKTGDWVVVERRRDQGAIRERTVKQVEVVDGIPLSLIRLWPRSSNPKWKEPVDMANGAREGEEGVEAVIVGLVIGAYDPHF